MTHLKIDQDPLWKTGVKVAGGAWVFLTFVYLVFALTLGVEPPGPKEVAPAVCDRNHVEYDAVGRPVYTEYCDFQNGKCYIIIDSKKVVQKYKCDHKTN